MQSDAEASASLFKPSLRTYLSGEYNSVAETLWKEEKEISAKFQLRIPNLLSLEQQDLFLAQMHRPVHSKITKKRRQEKKEKKEKAGEEREDREERKRAERRR